MQRVESKIRRLPKMFMIALLVAVTLFTVIPAIPASAKTKTPTVSASSYNAKKRTVKLNIGNVSGKPTKIEIQYCPSSKFGAETYFAKTTKAPDKKGKISQTVAIRKLERGTWYFRVKAVYKKGNSGWSKACKIKVK